MRRYMLLKQLLRKLTYGRMRLDWEPDGEFYMIEDRDAPFCHSLDRVTVCYSLDEVAEFIRHLEI